ncbi:MAG: hypothetical protein DMF61_23655 [Blastocatellia bacterium AA13]|nr:MAG: hypothetical protein DMF61_23655 [Blastocatellia bacterium AA13]
MELIPLVLGLIGYAVLTLSLIVGGLLFLRVLVSWISSNPFTWLAYNLRRITEPMVVPIRQQFGGRYFRFDLMPLVVGVMIVLVGSFAASLIWQFTSIVRDVIYTLESAGPITAGFIARTVIGLLSIAYVAAILIRVFLPFFGRGYRSRIFLISFRMTEPLLKPLRRIFVAGMFDFSPFVALLIVQLVTKVLLDSIH